MADDLTVNREGDMLVIRIPISSGRDHGTTGPRTPPTHDRPLYSPKYRAQWRRSSGEFAH